MADQELKTRVTVDAGDATAKLDQLASAQRALTDLEGQGTATTQQAAQANEAAAKASGAAATANQHEAAQVATLSQRRGELKAQLLTLIEEQRKYDEEQKTGGHVSDLEIERNRQRREQIEKVGQQVHELNEVEKQATQTVEKHGAAEEAFRRQMDGVKDTFTELGREFLGFTAIAAGIIKIFDAITEAAQKSHEKIVEVGKDLASLAAIKGGQLADEVHEQIEAVVDRLKLGPEGEKQLTQGAVAFVQSHPQATPEQINAAVQRLGGLLAAVPGEGGHEQEQVLNQLRITQKFTESKAEAVAITGEYGDVPAGELGEIAERLRGPAGEELLARYLAAHPGLSSEAKRQVNSVLDALHKTQANGRIDEGLQRLLGGDAAQLDDAQRLDRIAAAIKQGGRQEAIAREILGGQQAENLVVDLAAQKDTAATRAILDKFNTPGEDLAGEAVARQEQSRFVSAARRQAGREQDVAKATEDSSLSELGERIANLEHAMQVSGGGSAWQGSIIAGVGAFITSPEGAAPPAQPETGTSQTAGNGVGQFPQGQGFSSGEIKAPPEETARESRPTAAPAKRQIPNPQSPIPNSAPTSGGGGAQNSDDLDQSGGEYDLQSSLGNETRHVGTGTATVVHHHQTINNNTTNVSMGTVFNQGDWTTRPATDTDIPYQH